MLTLLLSALFSISYGFNCCVVHFTPESCTLEGGKECTFLDANDPSEMLADTGIDPVTNQPVVCVSLKWKEDWIATKACATDPSCTPTPPPPPPPGFKPASVCVMHACTQTEKEYNIAFIIDESGSVGKTNYLISLDFIENMISNDIAPNAKISMLAFGSNNDRMYRFTDSQNDQRAGALEAITDERNNYNGGSTCLAKAINEILNEYRNSQFNTGSEHKLFIMTDGLPNCGWTGTQCNDFKNQFDILGITTYVVGVGSGFSKSAVQCLVNEPKDKYILDVPRFNSEDFYRIQSQLRHTVCPVVFEESNLFVNNMSNIVFNGDNVALFWFMVVIIIIFGIGWYSKNKLCQRNGKYKQLNDNIDSSYGSVQAV